MFDPAADAAQSLLDRAAQGRLGRRGFLRLAGAAGIARLLDPLEAEHALAAGENQDRNRQSGRSSYDYIVVGAGAAGCIIASRLAQTGAEVLLIEAGGTDELPQVSNPSVWFTNIGGPLDWNFKAAPSSAVDGRSVPVAMGRVLGGGTSINAMLWVRGLAQDFDDWAYNGCDGWGFREVLPHFKALEDWEGGANEWRGVGGPVHICTSSEPHPTAKAFLGACREMNIPILSDMNGPMREGAGYVNMSIARDGSRASASRAFLRPNLNRPNLTLALQTQAAQLLFSQTRCSGVRIQSGNGLRDIAASREVILSAGGIASAKLLMLSGIGDSASLRKLGITPVLHLPGVGQNFQDHPLLFGVVFQYKGTMPPRSPHSNAVEVAAYIRSDSGKEGPNIKMVLMQLPVLTPELGARFPQLPPDSFTISPALVRPSSRGALQLTSADWQQPAALQAGFLSTDADLTATARCIELCRELGHQKSYDGIRAAELVPGKKLTLAGCQEFARRATISFGHPVGTCKMGTDALAVVDPQLRVHGARGLRVCDSSIMPRIITGPTNAATQMIASKAAQMILAKS
jgi:choline dehydrogenase